MRQAIAFLPLILAAACGSGSDDETGGPDGGSPQTGGGGKCSVTLTGDLSGTFGCNATAGKKSSESTSIVGVLVGSPPSGVTMISFAVRVPDTVTARTYAASELDGGATILKGTTLYAATMGRTMTGTLEPLLVTSATLELSDQGTDVYEVHGSGAAELTGAGGGSVSMRFTF